MLAHSKAALYGYTLVIRTAHPGAPPTALGWTDHKTRTCYIYADRLWGFGFGVWEKVALHEVGHARWHVKSRTPGWWRSIRKFTNAPSDQRVEEDYCEVYSRTAKHFLGVGYTFQSPRPSALKMAWLKLRL
jgi:hypothetical protein